MWMSSFSANLSPHYRLQQTLQDKKSNHSDLLHEVPDSSACQWYFDWTSALIFSCPPSASCTDASRWCWKYGTL